MGQLVNLRIWSGVGHGQQTGLVVLQLEVLVCELLAIDGLAASTLYRSCQLCVFIFCCLFRGTDIAASEVTTLQHELRDDSVKLAALVAKALLAGAESAEVLSSFWDYIVVEVEVDPASLGCGFIKSQQASRREELPATRAKVSICQTSGQAVRDR